MSNYKIRVNGKSESKEAQELFFELGYEKGVCSTGGYPALIIATPESRFQKTPYSSRATSLNHEAHSQYKEITLPDLRDLVVLKRNDVGDATHTDPNEKESLYFRLFGDWWNLFTGGRWQQFCHMESPRSAKLKPIEKKEMKEYLDKQQDGTYKLIKADGGCIDRDWIEIPTGAEKYIQLSGNNRSFYKNGFKEFWCSGKWLETACNKENLKTWNGFPVLWQRNPEPKQAKFLVKTDSGYVLQVLDESTCGADVVRIPDGAEIAIEYTDGRIYFWTGKDSCKWVDGELIKSKYPDCLTSKQFLDEWPDSKVLWKRGTLNDQVASADQHTHPEELPFIDDEPLQSLNNQYAEIEKVRQSAWQKQEGGNHYKTLKIQPMQYALENKLDYAQANVVKYVTRHADKNGKEDLLKAIHNLELMIEFYYGDEK